MIEKTPHDHPARKDRVCTGCGEFKKAEEFGCHKSARSYGGYQAFRRCNACEKDRKLKDHLRRSYNLGYEDYLKMVEEQDNRCYLCGEEPSDVYGRLVVDHCHRTGKVRKLLCRMCNIHLTKIESCPEYFNRVKEYLA
jgi:hypothetical protein